MNLLTVGVAIAEPALSERVLSALHALPVRILFERASSGEPVFFVDQLKRLSPDALFVDVAGLQEPIPDFMRRVKALPNPPAVVAVHPEKDPEIILSAMRAGVTEFIHPPVEESLKTALDRIASQRESMAPRPAARTLGFLSAKGGCGATTICAHVGFEMARAQADVLLADFDMDAGMVGFWTKSKATYSMLDAVRNIDRLDLSLWKAIVANSQPHLDVISSSTEPWIGGEEEAGKLFRVMRFAQQNYDWVLADLGRGRNAVSFCLSGSLDTLVVVTTADVTALYQVKALLQRLDDAGFDRSRTKVVLNRFDRKHPLSINELSKLIGRSIELVIPDDPQALDEALHDGRFVSRNTDFGKRVMQFARGLTGAPEGETRAKTAGTLGLGFFRSLATND